MRFESSIHSMGTLLILQCVLASCATAPQFTDVAVEPDECEIISRVIPHGDIAPVAKAAPPYSWFDNRPVGAPHSHASSAALEGCQVLSGRLSDTGIEVSRVAFNNEKSRAVVEIDCGPTYLERNYLGTWSPVATYTSVHGCYDLP
jgi:hypothetical protein